MKTTKLLLFAFLGLALSITSCNDEEDDNVQPDVEPITLDCNSFQSSNPEAITLLEDRGNGVDYIIDCKMQVFIDLVIEPGVNIEFTDNAGLEIYESGSLNAVGTSNDQIIFSGVDKVKGSWLGILNYSDDVKNRLEHCVIDYAGGGAFNSNGNLGSLIIWSITYMRLKDVTISNGAAYGVNAVYSDYDLEFDNCTITNCDMPFYINAQIAHKISGGDFTGNNTDVIRLNGAVINTAQTWSDLGVPYRLASSPSELLVQNGTLTIEPGVTIEFESGEGIEIGDSDASSLIAKGTASNPILFTGVTKTAGSWKSIYFSFTKSPLNEISNAIIEYAGSANTDGAIEMWSEPVVNVNNVEFRDIGNCALYAKPSTTSPNTNLTESNNPTNNVAGGYLCGD